MAWECLSNLGIVVRNGVEDLAAVLTIPGTSGRGVHRPYSSDR